ncbi:polysaccharide pyruvyl transferase family protein [Myceligenerans xiligouense]|uniref:Pyruvyl transferase EpsO n=1 Tax=Myceligenerans xiligouense TaxID=253184 RepID=A0A3N4YKL7_9MICO|nr:polysaccharide pyruvyl transferase family protein [Myceligenerans xiligouense]RPF19854.1 pyruvyl transferase EpsO [Myceligenerans xiligouense]
MTESSFVAPRTLHEIRQATLVKLEAVVGTNRDVALLQAPTHPNVGDTLIWLGELAYFKTLGLRVRYVSDLSSYDPVALRRCLPPDGAILITGGGNFGDLWYDHQQDREQVAHDFLDRRIVQLPQSVWFESPERAARSNAALRHHLDLTVLVRDRASGARMAEQLADVATGYCWDMALGWAPPRFSASARPRQPLVLARVDTEASSGLAAAVAEGRLGFDADVVSWRHHGPQDLARRALRALPLASNRLAPLRGAAMQPHLRRTIAGIHALNMRRGLRLFANRPFAVVDRLHAHVLAGLLGVPHVVLDNSYGKIGAVHDEYTHVLPGAHFARSIDEAAALAQALSSQAKSAV